MSREAKGLIAILVFVVVGMVGLFLLMSQSEEPPAVGDKTKLVRQDSHQTGSGAVEVVEFGDYQCPACGNAEPMVQQLLREYDGKITFYFRNFPLSNIHPNALAAANAAESAGDLGKFWEMHNLLYAEQSVWSELPTAQAIIKFGEYAAKLDIDTDKVKQAATAQGFKERIAQDMADGEVQNVNSTPTFFVNGKIVTNSSDLKAAIDEALKAY